MHARRWMFGLLPVALASPALAAPPAIAKHTCPNGLEVLVVENHALPLMTVEYAAKNGSMTEPPDYNGLSHLYEHMFFKANAKLPSQEAFMDRVRELGMSFNGTTSQERVNYFFTTTSDHFKDAMSFMKDAVVTPKFDSKELDRERVVVTGEMDRNEASPYYFLNHQVEQEVWWKYPSRKDPLGNRKTVLATTPAQMKTIQARYYVPNNSVLVLTGDVKADEVFAMADALYTDWKKAEDPFKKYPLVDHPPIKASKVVLVVKPQVQTFSAEAVWQGPSTVGPTVKATYAADLLTILMGEPSSKFQKAIVDSGLCVGAGLSWFTQKNVGPINLGFEAEPDAAKAKACTEAVLAELPKMKAPDYFSDEEMGNAVHVLEIAQVKEREKLSEFSHTVTFWWASAGLDYYTSYVDELKKVTRADLASYLDTFVLGKPFILGVLVSPQVQAAGISEAELGKWAGITAVPAGFHAPTKPTTKKEGSK